MHPAAARPALLEHPEGRRAPARLHVTQRSKPGYIPRPHPSGRPSHSSPRVAERPRRNPRPLVRANGRQRGRVGGGVGVWSSREGSAAPGPGGAAACGARTLRSPEPEHPERRPALTAAAQPRRSRAERVRTELLGSMWSVAGWLTAHLLVT
ncbi:translation initiation factor IF-2-like [Trichosurus vulpecula]|uniref:translation initiation factor IF-2-like n=1 Tax=Trichosurus vulpecula TaxID=9337 RepID=UPI00186B38CF|nr:translation initiation factor IF-2-like [Trichosurus vulpecula]